MGIRIARQTLIFISVLIMLTGLFGSRAALSIGMIGFLAATCLHRNFIGQCKNLLRERLLLGLCLLFFLPFLSGLWSNDQKEWADIIRIKLPLLLMPLAFAGNWQFSSGQWKNILRIFILFLVGGVIWSLVQYGLHYDSLHRAYLEAKVIPTPLENDHVRFSWLVAVGVLACLAGWKMEKPRWVKMLYAFIAMLFIVYLHILSARTGLLALYVLLLIFLLHTLLQLKAKKALPLLLAILLLPLAAWFLLPTFQNRIKYHIYDWQHVQQATYLPGANDGNRYWSMRAGWHILKENPLGVGTGDLIHETKTWYQLHVPGMQPGDMLYPSSEWLIYGGAAGWIGIIVLTLVLALPLLENDLRRHIIWISLNIIAGLSFLFDIGLEVQFGVFLYVFLVLWWWKWLKVVPETI